MINSLLEVTIFWNQSIEGVYYAINYTLVVLMAISALAAIILVMLQPGNSQGIDALGGTSETFYGKNKGRSIESKLKMWTIICPCSTCRTCNRLLYSADPCNLGSRGLIRGTFLYRRKRAASGGPFFFNKNFYHLSIYRNKTSI